jgi:hypothetical protein
MQLGIEVDIVSQLTGVKVAAEAALLSNDFAWHWLTAKIFQRMHDMKRVRVGGVWEDPCSFELDAFGLEPHRHPANIIAHPIIVRERRSGYS